MSNFPAQQTVKVKSGYTLGYREAGKGHPVVFIHGSGPGASGHSNFKKNYMVLADAGYRSIVVDLIGYGVSSKPDEIDYTLDLFSDTLLELLDHLGLKSVTLVGNSLGGAIAIDIALKRPAFVDKLVLMVPGGIETREVYFAMPGIQKMVSGFTGPGFDEAGLAGLLKNLVHDPKHITPDLAAERFAVMKTQPKAVLARMKVPDLTPRLAELKAPILGFWGSNDAFCPVSGGTKLVQHCHNAHVVLQSERGHWVMVEYTEMFNKALLDFLKA